MTKEQAGNVLAILNAGFPQTTLEQASALLWIDEVSLLNSYDVGVETARVIVREGDRFPLVKEFRRTYHAVNARRREAIQKLPEAARSTDVPEWVQVWWWDRHNTGQEDWQAFPQQNQGVGLSMPEYEAKRDAWAEAGSPTIGGTGEIIEALSA